MGLGLARLPFLEIFLEKFLLSYTLLAVHRTLQNTEHPTYIQLEQFV